MAFMTINLDAQKIRRINSRCTKRRVAGKGGEDEQPSAKICILRIFTGCKKRRTKNFENSQLQFDFPWSVCNKTRSKIIRN